MAALPEPGRIDPESGSTGRADGESPPGPGTPSRRSRYVRDESAPRPALTPQKVALLRYLAEMRFLSLPQLARLACPSEKSARRHLRELFDAGLVDVVPVARASLAPAGDKEGAQLLRGSAPNVYVSTETGMRLLVEAGHLGPEALRRPPPRYGPRNGLFLAHELLVRGVRVWLEAMAAAHPGRRVLAWRDGTEAAIPVPGHGAVRPDAWFVQQLLPGRPSQQTGKSGQTERSEQPAPPGPPLVLVGLAEIDRGTERGGRRWGEKLDAYQSLFSDRAALPAATGYVNARVLVVTPDARRRDALAALLVARARETGAPADLPGRFWLSAQETLAGADPAEACWRRPGVDGLWPLASAGLLAGWSAAS